MAHLLDLECAALLTVSTIIPAHKANDDFYRCLLALATVNPPPDEVIVVADGNPDGVVRLAEAFGARVVAKDTQRGPARSRNVGARIARGALLFFLDSDVAVCPNAIGQVEAAFRDEPELAAVFGSYDDAPSAPNFLSQYKNLFHHYVHQTAREEASTFWAACGAVRREVFLGLGGFDERYPQPSIEDIEFGYRLKRFGHRIRLCKALQVKHLKRWSVISLLKSDFLHRALPWTQLILREHRFIDDLNLKLPNRVSVILTFGLLAASIGACYWALSLAAAGLLGLALLILNAPLYRFLWRKRGLWFLMRAIPWHWLYYLYGGLAFAIGVAHYLLCKRTYHEAITPGSCKDSPARTDGEGQGG